MDRPEPSELNIFSGTGQPAGEERLVASVLVAPTQLELAGTMTDLGASLPWVQGALGVISRPVKTVAKEVRKQVLEAGYGEVQIKKVVGAEFAALSIVAVQQPMRPEDVPQPITGQAIERLQAIRSAAIERLKWGLKLIADLAPLACSEAEFAKDALLRDVAHAKAKAIQRYFAFAILDRLPDDLANVQSSLVMARKRPPFLQGEEVELTIRGSVSTSRAGAVVKIGGIDGKKSLDAQADHGDAICFEAHAAGMGGTADITVHQRWSYCQAAPQLKRVATSLKRIVPRDDMREPLLRLKEAVEEMIDGINRQRRESG